MGFCNITGAASAAKSLKMRKITQESGFLQCGAAKEGLNQGDGELWRNPGRGGAIREYAKGIIQKLKGTFLDSGRCGLTMGF